MKDFSEQVQNLPQAPGVYLMYNEANEIIYVGKAISLRNRVSSYFQKSSSGKTPKVLAMVEHIDHFEYILVENEVEALVLESNFIKEHAPKYNILLRDDKQYPYIRISNEKFPRLQKVRQVENDGASYFGPYPNAYAVNETIQLLQRIYSIRTCNLDFDKGARLDRPCLNYFIEQCPAPCIGIADEAAYMANMAEVETFLKGRDQSLRKALKEQMEKAAAELKFERAARFRDDLLNLDALLEKQQVTFTSANDADIIAMARGTANITIQVFFLRAGKVVDQEHFSMREEFQEESADILSSFLKQFYLDASYVPREILLEQEPSDMEAIQAFLTHKKGQKVTIHVPQRGKKSALMETVRINAEDQLAKQEKREQKKERNKDRGIAALENLLGLEDIRRIESYDVSNISGVQNVGSMVVYDREKKVPKEYRKFKIRGVDGIDEYASQREMLTRRFEHGLRDIAEGKTETGFGQLPSLVIMDGGKGQVNIAEGILKDRELDIPVIGLIKDDKHRTKALLYKGREFALEARSPLYKFMFAIQEEVHRFAINYHRKLREKDMVSSELDQIPGIGKVRKQSLLREMGSVERIKEAGLEELEAVVGMTKKAAASVYAYFHGE